MRLGCKEQQSYKDGLGSFLHPLVELLIALVFLLPSNAIIDRHLPAPILVIIQSCPYVVEVVEFPFNLVHSCTGELHQRKEKGHIVGDCEKYAFLVLKVLGVDLVDQFGSVGT